MAKATYWQKGASIDFLNATDAVIEAGTIVTLGKHAGVAGDDILPGHMGAVFVEGVFIVPTGGVAFTLGADVYFDGGKAETTGTAKLGWAIEAVGSDASEVKVKLG